MSESSNKRRFVGLKDGSAGKIAVVLVPQAGSGVGSYSSWPSELRNGASILRYEIPGRDRRQRDSPPDSIEAICRDLAESVLSLGLDSVVLAGHCMGALVADATASLLAGRIPVHVVASSVRPAEYGLYGAYTLEMSDREVLDEMNASLAVLGQPPVHPYFEQYALKLIRSDVHLLSQYFGIASEGESWNRSVISWSDDKYVPGYDREYWLAQSGSQVVELEGAPELFLVPKTEVLDILSDSVDRLVEG